VLNAVARAAAYLVWRLRRGQAGAPDLEDARLDRSEPHPGSAGPDDVGATSENGLTAAPRGA